jgi:magnesium transporter
MTTALVYSAGTVEEYADLVTARDADGTTWVHVPRRDAAAIEDVSQVFDLHPLAVEDVRNNVRAKTEEFDEYTFVLLRTAKLTRGETTFEEEILDEPVGVFFGDDWVVTIGPDDAPPIERVQTAVHREDSRLLNRGADFTAYRIADVIVDDYFDLLDTIEDTIETVEEDVLEATDRETLAEINSVRRELLSFRKILWPARDAVGTLARGDSVHVAEPTEKYFRDVYDHTVQLVDLTETYRELTIGARDIYLNSLSQSTNEVMKVLTVVATIFIPLTFIAGVYGMNFDPGASPFNMPELGWTYGYPASLLGMALVGLVLVAYFRRQGWV